MSGVGANTSASTVVWEVGFQEAPTATPMADMRRKTAARHLAAPCTRRADIGSSHFALRLHLIVKGSLAMLFTYDPGARCLSSHAHELFAKGQELRVIADVSGKLHCQWQTCVRL